MQKDKQTSSSLINISVLQSRHSLPALVVLCCRLVNLEKERNSIVFHKPGRLMEAKETEEEELKLALQRKAESENVLRRTAASYVPCILYTILSQPESTAILLYP